MQTKVKKIDNKTLTNRLMDELLDLIFYIQKHSSKEEIDQNKLRTAIKLLNELKVKVPNTRGKSDPKRDKKILSRIQKGEKIQDIATDLGISRQSVHKAKIRAKKAIAKEVLGHTHTYTHATDITSLMAIYRLLGGKRPANITKMELIRRITIKLEAIK